MRPLFSRSSLCLAALLAATTLVAQQMVVRPGRPDGIYRVGEKVSWTVEWPGPAAPPAARYTFKSGGQTETASGQLVFTGNIARLESGFDQPNTMLLEVTWEADEKTARVWAGAVAAPDQIRAAAPPPDDFDAFWADKLAELARVPANPRLEKSATGASGVDYWKITLDNIRGTTVRGQLARPVAGDKLPALLIVQWAGVYGLQPAWVTDRAAEGWLALNLNPHDLPIDEPEEFYARQKAGPLKDYWSIGNDDRDTSYYLRMYLSCYRAVEYLKSRPDWDGRTIVVTGGSQGGQQALMVAGLHPDVTAALALVPAACDMLAPDAGRAPGFPSWYFKTDGKDPAKVRSASRYYDPVNFARRIKCPVLIGAGLHDEVLSPPASILAAANEIRSYKEVILLADSGHQNVNGSQEAYNLRANRGWLPALRRGLALPVALSAQEDNRRLQRLLGINGLRPGADGRNQGGPNAANYDETKANPFPQLPDPLVHDDGTPVTTPGQWRTRRRAEIVEHFDREIYGRVPAGVPAVTWEVTSTVQETKGGVPVITRQLAGRVDNSAYPFLSVTLDLTLTVPAQATGPVPVMLHFGWPASILSRFPPPPGPSWEEQVIAHGWACATLVPTSFQADNGAGLTQGIIGLANRGQPRGVDDWGTLRAWAWGASRALDYFETDPALDARRAGIEGLSRYGKAALVTMAYDQRFAIGFIGSSGAGGATLHRRNWGERIENLASSGEYHWMAGNYLKYAGPLNGGDLPVDSHQLIALCAPRPVFISCGSFEQEGGWIDQRGQFLATVAAGPVYRLLGRKDLGTTAYPDLETAVITGELAFRQHRGGHTTLPNWPTFLTWADRYLASDRTVDHK